MKKKGLLVICFVTVLLLSLLGACTKPAPAPAPASKATPTPTPTPTSSPVKSYKWPDTMVIATSSIGTSYYARTLAWATILEETTGMKVRITPCDTLISQAQTTKQGNYFATGCQPPSTADMYEVIGDYASLNCGNFMRGFVWPEGDSAFGFMTRGNSGIKTPYDLKGKKITQTSSSNSRSAIRELFAWGNLTESDVQIVPFAVYQTGVSAVREGITDVTYLAIDNVAAVELEASPFGIHWLDLDPNKDPEAMKRFLRVRPVTTFGVANIGSAKGVWTEVEPSLVSAPMDKDPELVYQLTKWFDENYDKYSKASPVLVSTSFADYKKILPNLFFPIHEGAIRYLKEKGAWSDLLEARQQYNHDIASRYVKAYSGALKKAAEENIKVDPQNKAWQDFWANYKKELKLPQFAFYTGLPPK